MVRINSLLIMSSSLYGCTIKLRLNSKVVSCFYRVKRFNIQWNSFLYLLGLFFHHHILLFLLIFTSLLLMLLLQLNFIHCLCYLTFFIRAPLEVLVQLEVILLDSIIEIGWRSLKVKFIQLFFEDGHALLELSLSTLKLFHVM